MFKALNYSRGITAIMVLIAHTGVAVASDKYFGISLLPKSIFIAIGNAGVFYFFLLSGFIITHVHKNEIGNKNKFPHYLLKRIFRIYPIYWVIVVPIILYNFLANGFVGSFQDAIFDVIRNLLLFPINGSLMLAPAWSLKFEILFYLTFGLIILIGKRAIYFAGVALILIFFQTINSDNFYIFEHLVLFLMGSLIAFSLNYISFKNSWRVVFGVTGLLLICFYIFNVYFEFNIYLTLLSRTLGCLLILISALTIDDLLGNIDGNRFFKLMGDSSYSLYLLHYPLISILLKIYFKFTPFEVNIFSALFFSFLIIFICIYAACKLHSRIERPMMIRLSGLIKYQ